MQRPEHYGRLVVESEGPRGGGQRPERKPDITLVVPERLGSELFLEWSGAAHPLVGEVRVDVRLPTVDAEPADPAVNISPHPQGYVCYLNHVS